MQCARHPDVTADGTCERCGDFVCSGCWHPTYPSVCSRCGDRLPRGIAWEDKRYGLLPWRFVLTIRDVLVRPKIAFPGPARVAPGLLFVVACLLLSAVPFGLVTLRLAPRGLGATELSAAVAGSVALTAAGALLVVGAQSVSFGIGLLMVGRRRGVLRFGLRAASYAFVVSWLGFFIGAGASMAQPALGAATHAVWIGVLVLWPALAGRVFVHAARGLGLGTGKSVLAALGPTIVCTIPAALETQEQLGMLPQL